MKRNGCQVCSDGISRWLLHREDGPAVITPKGIQYWYKEGVLHREDGPAVITPKGAQRWFKEGKEYVPSAHEIIIYKMNEKHHSIL